MDTRVHAHIDKIERTSASISEDKNSVVVEPGRSTHEVTLSEEDFETWFDAFRKVPIHITSPNLSLTPYVVLSNRTDHDIWCQGTLYG